MLMLPNVLFGTLRDHYIALFSVAGGVALVSGFVGSWIGARFGARAGARQALLEGSSQLPSVHQVDAVAQGMDVVLMEIERIAEAQRYLAKALTDRPSLPSPRAEIERITPH